jgi:S-formylglutathione hydrolase FrmB
MGRNPTLNHWFRQVCRCSAGRGSVLLASVVLICACSAATSYTAPPPPTAAGASATSVAASSPSPATSAPPNPSIPARIVANKHLGNREQDLSVQSPALGGQVSVRLLLPAHYETEKARLWPVLYLLHGCCDSYVSWTRSTDIEQLTERSDILVVMPDGGKAGFYSDWQSGPRWETFHTTELPKLLTQHYRASPVAAVAGVSMGGLGALDYAARHPGMFTVAASFSGIVHTRLSNDESHGYLGLIQSQGEDPWHFGAILMQTWTPGRSTTHTTLHHNSKASGCSSPPATAVQDHSIVPARTRIPSKPRSEQRTGHSPAAYNNSDWTHRLTSTVQVRITGCIGNVDCTVRGH